MIVRALHCPTFVGRESELAALTGARRALARSRGSVVLVAGEAGIGKTRLLRQFIASVSRDTRPRHLALAQCVETAQRPFGPFRDLIASLSAAPGGAAATSEIAHAIEQLAPRSRAGGAIAIFDKGELFAGIAGYFLDLAAKRTTIIAIEDIHWADRSSLDFLTYLAPRVAGTRLLVVATYREEHVETHEPLFGSVARLAREATVSRIAVEAFDPVETQRLIDATLPVESSIGFEARRAIAARSEGNPFYAEELLKDALDASAGRRGGSLPISIRGAILERLTELTDQERRIVTHAAVLGQRFGPETLARTLGMDVDEVLPTLRRGRDLNVFVEERSTPVRFRFRHALTRQAVYDGLLRFDVRRVHEKLLETLEAAAEGERDLDALAYHADAADDAGRALRYNEEAGDAASAMQALPEARAFLERALARAVKDRDQARLTSKIAGVIESQGDTAGALTRFQSALARYRELGDFDAAADAVFSIINVMNNARDFTCVEYGIAFLEEDGHRIGSARRDALRATIGRLCTIQYDYARAEHLLSAVEHPEDLTPVRARLNYYLGRLHIFWGAGDIGAWRAAAKELLALAPSLTAYGAATVCYVVAQDASSLGCNDIADAAFDRADVVDADLAGATGIRSFGQAVRAYHLFMRGRIDLSRAHFFRSLALSPLPVARMARWFVGPMLACATGDAACAMPEDAAWFADLAREARVPWDARTLASAAAWKIASGAGSEARHLLRVALHCVERPYPGTVFVLALAAEHLDGEDLERLHRILDADVHPADEAAHASIALARAILMRRAGQTSESARLALSAAETLQRLGWPIVEARALEVAGRTDLAYAIYARCGAERDAVRLRPPHASEATTRGAGDGRLSARERDVADLVVRGETNAKIAEHLGISAKTVEKHMTSIFTKLGVRNRAQMVAACAPRATATAS